MRALSSRPFCPCDSRPGEPVVFIRRVQVHGPTPRCQRIGVISWSACCGTRHEASWRWSVWRKMPMGTSCTPSPSRGLTAPPASDSRPWNSWRSWPRSSPCRASIWCAMRGVWRRRASCGTRSFQHRANRGWTGKRRRLVPLPGAGPGSWGACLRWIWLPVPFAAAARSVLLLLLPLQRHLYEHALLKQRFADA
jgi:hypothetical protein